MQRSCLFLIFFSTAAFRIEGLKLLVDDAVVEDDDETWESDILFSYTPKKGKCSFEEPVPDAMTDGAKYYDASGGGTGADGGLSITADCAGSAKEVAKYCTPLGTDTKYYQKVANVITNKASYTLAKFVHYMAKLASMNNADAAVTPKVVSMEIKKDKTAATFFKLNANGFSASADYLCYTSGGISWAKNDPKVQNIRGEEFEIMATGTFSLLSLTLSQQSVLEASATIDRAGSRCGATYIQNISLSGQWVKDTGVSSIQVKAEAAVPKVQALQINFNGDWQSATMKSPYTAVTKSSAKEIILQLNKIKVLVSVDSHRIYEAGTKTRRFANFLNVNFNGLQSLGGFSVGGLLGTDSHDSVTQPPLECESTQLTESEKTHMFSEARIA